MHTPKINFLNGLTSGASFFDISTYLREKYFNVVLEYLLLRGPPQNGTPKNQFIERFNLRHHLGVPPLGIPSQWTPQNYFSIASN